MLTPARVALACVDGRAALRDLDYSHFLSPRLIRADGRTATVALIASSATLLAGDGIELEVDVDDGVCLELIEPAGTVAYNARGGRAGWHADVRVTGAGRLAWAAAPFVVAEGADVRRDLHITLDAESVAAVHEVLVLGRGGERRGGALRSTTFVRRAGRPLLVEDLDLRDPDRNRSPALLGDNRVVATALLLGARPGCGEQGAHETLLAGEGAFARTLATQAHLAVEALAPTWHHWRRQAMIGNGAGRAALSSRST